MARNTGREEREGYDVACSIQCHRYVCVAVALLAIGQVGSAASARGR